MDQASSSEITDRLREVATLAADGLTDKEIATRLGLSVHTVDAYWRRLRERYDTPSRTSVVARLLFDSLAEEREALLGELRSVEERERRLQAEIETLKGWEHNDEETVEAAWEAMLLGGEGSARNVGGTTDLEAFAEPYGAVTFRASLGIPPCTAWTSATVERVLDLSAEALVGGSPQWMENVLARDRFRIRNDFHTGYEPTLFDAFGLARLRYRMFTRRRSRSGLRIGSRPSGKGKRSPGMSATFKT